MKREQNHSDPRERQSGHAPAAELLPLDVPRHARACVPDTRGPDTRAPDAREEPLKCVWSGYPNYERTCRSRIPASVVVKAWHREMQLKGTVEGFFYFAWRSGVWLAFGLPDGGVRGVYCPTHCSERDSREAGGEEEPWVHRPKGIALQ